MTDSEREDGVQGLPFIKKDATLIEMNQDASQGKANKPLVKGLTQSGSGVALDSKGL